MKQVLILAIVLTICLFNSNLFAQGKITVQDGTNTTFYTDLLTAVNEAPAGSSIYIPGGSFPIGGDGILRIDKQLSIYGVGHYPDAILIEKGKTIINGSIALDGNADNSHIEGFYLSGNVQGNDANDDLSNVVISRINFDNLSCGVNYSAPFWHDIIISECVIRGNIDNATAFNMLYEKNLIQGVIHNSNNTNGTNQFDHNIFYFNSYYSQWGGGWFSPIWGDISYTLFTNNIFLTHDYNNGYGIFQIYGGSNILNNNIFQATISIMGSNTGINNTWGVDMSLHFTQYSTQAFSYGDDYHLKSDSPFKNAGTDGTDIGIYGSSYPYKENAIPMTPHIKSSTVSTKTTNGKISVKVEVEAQTK